LAVAAMVIGAAQVRAAGLTFVPALDDTAGASQNLFPAAGGALSTVLDNSQSTAGDGKWGFVAAGANADLYESSTENSPELRMHAAVPNGNYDVYVVYWAGNGGQAQRVRAGISSMPGGNTLFGNGNGGTTVGPLAGSAAWTVKPADNSNTVTDNNGTDATTRPGNATGGTANTWTVNPDPFYDHPPAGGDSAYLMRLGQVNTSAVTAAGGTGFDIFVDDGPSGSTNDTTRFQGLAYVAAGTPIFLTATIDQSTGDVKINNPTQQDFHVANYQISSTTGSLDASQWHTITSHSPTNLSDTDPWAVTAPTTPLNTTTSTPLLIEAETPAVNGATFANTTGQMDLGNVWRKSAIQDVTVSMQLTDGSTVTINPTYTGTAYASGDFNADGLIDKNDFVLLIGNLNKSFTGQTVSQTYSIGDINQDGKIDRNDFVAFRNAYCAANGGCTTSGAGSFAAKIGVGGAVPEPATWLLLAMGGGALCFFRGFSQVSRRNLFQGLSTMMQGQKLAAKIAAVVAVTIISGYVAPRAQAQLSPVTGWARCDAAACTPTVDNIVNANTSSPTIGNGTSGNANNETIFGTVPNVHLNPGQEVTMTMQMQVNKAGSTTIPGRDVRFGIWNAVNPNATAGTGWVGYMAPIASGGTPGRLEVRNPDSNSFNSSLFLSDQGGSLATTAGPAPATGSPLDGSGTGTAGPRYFLLAESGANGNAAYQYNRTYNVSFHIGRFGTSDNEVSVTMTDANPTSPVGDYNNDGTVNAADYAVWRSHLGTAFALPNRAAANTGNVSQADYDSWKSGFGSTGGTAFVWNLGGGTDYDGVIPPATTGTPPTPVAVTSHLTFDFNRVGMLFGGATGADSAQLTNVQFGVDTIQTLNLNVNTTTGKANISNTLATPLSIDYYEISSVNGDLVKASWTGIDGTAASTPDGNGWDAAGGASNNFLAEGNLTSALTLASGGSTISLGNVFNPATVATNRDLRFFIGLSNGSVIRGNVNYGASPGAGAAVPEPCTLAMLLSGGLGVALVKRRRMAA
jgi:hypothetical protein